MNLFAEPTTDKSMAAELYEFGKANYAPAFQSCEGSPPYPTQKQIEEHFDAERVVIVLRDLDTGEICGFRIDGRTEETPTLWAAYKIGNQGGYGTKVPNLSMQYAAHMWAASWKAHGKIRLATPVDPNVNPVMAAAQVDTQAMARLLYEEGPYA